MEKSVTQSLADFYSNIEIATLPDWTLEESKRALINFLGVSLAAVNDHSPGILAKWIQSENSNPEITIIGMEQKSSPVYAALMNGYLAHLHDFDDTHFPTILHPSAPIWPSVLAVAEQRSLTGREALAGFVIGAELACRLAMSVHPWHYDQGWHITGTVGVMGAAGGAAFLLNLGSSQFTSALGLSGTQAGGVREVFGTHAKALHAGKAASNGLQAALLAEQGLEGPLDIIGGSRGFWAVLSGSGFNPEIISDSLGSHWEMGSNGLKPYANGVVSHALQDALIGLREQYGLLTDEVEAISLTVNPLVFELMNRPNPQTSLEAKFSFQHGAAIALTDGQVLNDQFDLSRVNDPLVMGLRGRISALPDPTLEEDSAHVMVKKIDGSSIEMFVNHASGSPKNPMTDKALDEKFLALATKILPDGQARQLLAVARDAENITDVKAIMSLTRPAR